YEVFTWTGVQTCALPISAPAWTWPRRAPNAWNARRPRDTATRTWPPRTTPASRTEPTGPTEPTEPPEPTEPTEPTEPAEPTEPTEPAGPTEPTPSPPTRTTETEEFTVSKPPLPAEAVDLLRRANPCVMATLRSDGSPVSTATWYLWEDGRVLLNLDEGRVRLKHLRRDPRVTLTVLAEDDWYT